MTTGVVQIELRVSDAEVRPVGGPLHGRRIAVVGMGYVGLPTALSFADADADVVGLDVSEARIAAIKANRVDLLPQDWQRLVDAFQQPLLRLTADPAELSATAAVIICVPTPIDAHSTPDLGPLTAACATVVEHARPGQTIILTSTTYAGCTRDLLVKPLENRGFRVGSDVFVCFSPERIDPGVASHTPAETPRVVGGYTPECAQRALGFLTHTASGVHVVSSLEAAEMTKLLENTFRAVNIALANEFANAARELSVDVMEVIEAASTKPYGYTPFYPGAGVGGHCIPCDPHYLLWQLRAKRISSPLVEAAMSAIASRPREVVNQAWRVLAERGQSLRGARVLVVGVSYKPGLSDVRESPALAIIDMLAAEGADVSYADPHVAEITTQCLGRMQHHASPEEGHWDLIIAHTMHPGMDYEWLTRHPVVLDTTYRLNSIRARHLL